MIPGSMAAECGLYQVMYLGCLCARETSLLARIVKIFQIIPSFNGYFNAEYNKTNHTEIYVFVKLYS